jgi:hypothetical protein
MIATYRLVLLPAACALLLGSARLLLCVFQKRSSWPWWVVLGL